MKYVIIGNSTAAIGAVEGIREVDRDGSITIVGAEPYHTYSRPLISYYLLGETDRERMKYRPDDFYERNGVQTILGRKAVKIGDYRVTLGDDTEIPFDKLLLATGSTPFVPPAEGLENITYHNFYTLGDALKLESELAPDKDVLIIGAGLIGLKCAEGIKNRVKSVTVVDLAPKVLSSILDDESAALIKTKLEENGLKLILGDSAARFVGNGAKGFCRLKSGTDVDFDILVMAVGVRPNTELTGEKGGFVTDEFMRTSNPDIYAAGDCAKGFDAALGDKRVLALLPNAARQGRQAGRNMALSASGTGAEIRDCIPMNAIGFFGTHICTAGIYDGERKVYKDGDKLREFFVKDDKLRGFILINSPERAGIYTALIRDGVPLTDTDTDALFENPGLIAFSRAYRDEKLAGVV